MIHLMRSFFLENSRTYLSSLRPHRCCFYEGRPGVLITAWIEEIMSVVIIIVLGLYLLHLNQNHRVAHSSDIMQLCIITIIVMMLCNILLSGLLLYGTYNETKRAIVFYLLLRMMYLLAGLITVLYFGSQLCMNQKPSGFLVIMIGLLIMGLEIFLWVVALCYHHTLNQHSEETATLVNSLQESQFC